MIAQEIKQEIDELFKSITNEHLKDWEIQFVFRLNNVPNIMIYTRSKSFPIEKYKEVVLHIPIPNMDQVSWGVHFKKYIYNKDYLDPIRSNFQEVEIEYKKFNNPNDYLKACIKKAIYSCLSKGITINNQRIRITKYKNAL